MRRNLLAVVGLVTLFEFSSAATQVNVPNRQSAGTSGASLKDRFIGTWKLVSFEQRGAGGEVIPTAAGAITSRTGYIIYDPAGYMAVSIMPIGRKKYAGPTSFTRPQDS
jgi:hypothetical protein